jgi:hypothetical protein
VKWKHPAEVGETYQEHFWYAYKMAWKMYAFAFRLIIASFLFTIHAALPCFPVPKGFDLLTIGEEGRKFCILGARRDEQREEYEARSKRDS